MKCLQCGAQIDGDFCPYCGTKNQSENASTNNSTSTTQTSATQQPVSREKVRKPFYKKWWFWVIVVILILNIIGRMGEKNDDSAREFVWSNMELAELLPEPESNYGELAVNSNDYLSIDVLKISDEQYHSYIDACREKNFNLDVEEYGTSFKAKNSEGYELTLYYIASDKEMSIDLTAPSKVDNNKKEENNNTTEEKIETDEAEKTETNKSDKNENSVTSSGIRSDFKAAMDSYEKFFDEYVTIMKKYANNPNDMSILGDYAKYMGKYAEMMEDFEKWESEDMNTAETAYYIEVQARINKKLLEVAQ